MRREERDWLVAPVVREALRRILRIELEDRQKLDGGNPEIYQVGNLLDQPGVGAARLGRYARARMLRETPNMKLVDDRFGERTAERMVVLPVVSVPIAHDAFH